MRYIFLCAALAALSGCVAEYPDNHGRVVIKDRDNYHHHNHRYDDHRDNDRGWHCPPGQRKKGRC